MTYDGKIPEFALQPAKEAPKQREIVDDGFDPTPYDRLLTQHPENREMGAAAETEAGAGETGEPEKSIKNNPDMQPEKGEERKQKSPWDERFEIKFDSGLNSDAENGQSDLLEKEEQAWENAAGEENRQNSSEKNETESSFDTERAGSGTAVTEGESNQNSEDQTESKSKSGSGFGSGPEYSKELTGSHFDGTNKTDAEKGSQIFNEDEPVNMPESAEEPAPEKEAVTIRPMAGAAVYQELKLQTVIQQAETRIFIEEDILVPDVKPDLISILSIDGYPVLSGKEFQISGQDEKLRITGEAVLQTVYLPEDKHKEEPIAVISSRLPFKTDWQTGASPISHLTITPTIEKIEHTVINERKFRAKITVKLQLKEYAEKTMNLFQEMKGEELQLKKEKIQLSNIPIRKEETLEISEHFRPKDSQGRPVKLLKSDIHITENHKQVTSEKMVINGTAMCSILYMAEQEKEGEVFQTPEFMQNKVDFTQFVLLDQTENISGSRVAFDGKDLSIKIDDLEDEGSFLLSGSIGTAVEIYETVEQEVVSDFYHQIGETAYETEERVFPVTAAAGSTEANAREMAAIPENQGALSKVLYLTGKIKESQNTIENGRVRTEGILQCKVLCLGEGEGAGAFSVTRDIPFRGTVELPDSREHMRADSRIFIRDLWCDQINDRQVELNASLLIAAEAVEDKTLRLIKNPYFIERKKTSRPAPMVIYIAKKGDTLWSVAKRYKVTTESLAKINELPAYEPVKEGMRLLVVR